MNDPENLDVVTAAVALFCSFLQPSEHPNSRVELGEIERQLQTRGVAGCACQVAAEYGEHPQEAAARMCWCRAEAVRVLDLDHPAA